MQRTPTYQEYCHERMAAEFGEALSSYDTQRRVETLVDDFLTDDMLRGQRVLDVGCGLGFFSERLVQRGADVLACDIGSKLVAETRQRAGCAGEVADALRLEHHFGANQFDGVVSSECVEHTPQPLEAIRQMVHVIKPGGFLALSTPNLLWSPAVKVATRLGMRPFDGHEHFTSWRTMRRTLAGCGMQIDREFGLHLFPFQLPFHQLSTWCDRNLQCLRVLMVNVCVLARKRSR